MQISQVVYTPHGTVKKIAKHFFEVDDNFGNITRGGESVIQSIIGNSPLGGANISSTNIGGAFTTSSGSSSGLVNVSGNLWTVNAPAGIGHWNPPPALTAEEEKEIEILEAEARNFVKTNRIKKFQALPRHLRQDIVDESYIKDLVESLMLDDSKDFEHMDKLNNLRAKRSFSNLNGVISVGGWSPHQENNWKYGGIIKHFTTKELAEAHAQICIEEDINN